MVKWAAKHALEVICDVQLGFEGEAEIVWKGYPGGYLVDLLPKLLQEVRSTSAKPNAVILHCGTNDLGSVPHHLIQRTLKDTIACIRQEYPNTLVFWSDIIPRRRYSVARSTSRLDKARKKVNRYAHKLLIGPQGGAIEHEISYRQPGLYFPKDEVHLSGAGNALLVEDWRRAIQEYVALWR